MVNQDLVRLFQKVAAAARWLLLLTRKESLIFNIIAFHVVIASLS